ncbi:cell cycle link protein [Black medic leaf roll virus]|uniref:Cell cycle link protein n=1 Tax=Black medic leaf roll virus TaxID=2038729 RepID=V9TP53_9VIRU|nr:cell cycle link protein [Black medic leaf roll virus]
MGLRYFSVLPQELREKIVREHMREERKTEFLENAIEDSCRRYEALITEDPSYDDLVALSKFLDSLTNYVGNKFNTRCLIKWKKDVPAKIKYGVMEEQHLQLYGPLDMEDLLCGELLLPEEDEDDITYEDGMIVHCSQLDRLFIELGINVIYITVSNKCICTPLNKEVVIV